jgi:hypothetical protein
MALEAGIQATLPASYRHRQVDVVAVFDLTAQLAGICRFTVQVYLDKGLQLTVPVKDQFSESGVQDNKLLDTFSHRAAGSLHHIVAAGKIRHVRMKMYPDGHSSPCLFIEAQCGQLGSLCTLNSENSIFSPS